MQSLNVIEIPVKVCGNCKHWLSKKWLLGEWVTAVDAAGRAACGLQGIHQQLSTSKAPLAVIQGDDDAELETSLNFGCVLFEAKEEA